MTSRREIRKAHGPTWEADYRAVVKEGLDFEEHSVATRVQCGMYKIYQACYGQYNKYIDTYFDGTINNMLVFKLDKK